MRTSELISKLNKVPNTKAKILMVSVTSAMFQYFDGCNVPYRILRGGRDVVLPIRKDNKLIGIVMAHSPLKLDAHTVGVYRKIVNNHINKNN